MTIAYVKSASVYANTALILNGVAAGNLLVAFASTYKQQAVSPPVFSDNKGGTWNTLTHYGGPSASNIWTAIGYSMNAAGGNTTVSLASYGNDPGWSLHEYSGIATSLAFDKETGKYLETANPATDNVLTTQDNELLVGILADESIDYATTFGTGWNQRTAETSHIHITADKIVSSAGNYNYSMTRSASYVVLVMATFKGAAAPPTGAPHLGKIIKATSPRPHPRAFGI